MTSGLTRRRLVRSGVAVAAAGPVAALAACGGGGSSTASTTPNGERLRHHLAHKPPASPEAALAKLMAGNERYLQGKGVHDLDTESVRRVAIAEEQKPYAAILSCADSRVPPEVIFDQGLGDLFVVRIAGNTAQDPLVVGSVEYAAEHLGSILLMVLGHQSCGAVKAAVATVTEGAHQEGDIQSFVDPIVPVVEKAKKKSPDASTEALTEQSIQANIKHSVDELSHSEALLEHLVEKGKLKIVGAEYNLKSGKVELV